MNLTEVHKAIKDGDINALRAYWSEDPKAVNQIPILNNHLLMLTPLQLAVLLNKLDIVKLCLSIKGIDVNAIAPSIINSSNGEKTALSIAIEKDNKKMVKALLDAGAEVDIVNSNALTFAVEKEAYSAMDALIESGKDLDLQQDSALITAVELRNAPMVRKLSTLQGINPNVVLPGNKSLLVLAIENIATMPDDSMNDDSSHNDIQIVEDLLRIPGIKATESNEKGQSPFSTALDKQYSSLIPLLLETSGFRLPVYHKNVLLKKIIALPDKEVVKTLLRQVIDQTTILGICFWKKDGIFEPALSRGPLAIACAELKRLDPTFSAAKNSSQFFKNEPLEKAWVLVDRENRDPDDDNDYILNK